MAPPTASGAQPFDVAADEYQSPFSLPPRPARAPPPPASPFFDDAERAEAEAWSRSAEAVELEEEHGAVRIGVSGTRRRRDSQVGSYENDSGLSSSIFDGPEAGAVPSSLSR